MEHISEILRQTRINTSIKNTDTWSSAEDNSQAGTDCPICQGARIVHPLLDSGKPDFSRVIACSCVQEESDDRLQSYLARYSNLGSLSRFTFEKLLPQGRSDNHIQQEQFTRVYQAAKLYAAEPKGWFVLSGPSGSGKTHLAAAIANDYRQRGYPVLYQSIPDLLDRIRATFNPEDEIPYDEYFNNVRDAQLLVLDDLGTQTGTAWAKEKLDQLFIYRFNNELSTVIATNLHIEQLDERLQTRLANSELCQVYIIEEEQYSSGYSWSPDFEAQKNMTFASFDWRRVNLPAEQRENLEEAYRIAFDFAKSPEGWLVLQGANGCGKTHLAASIVNYRYQNNQPALFVVVTEFLDHLRYTFNPESKVSYDQLFESVKKAPLLVLDDFGEQSTTPWAQEKLYQVVNYRYNALLPTVITTVCSLDEIETRVGSRLIDNKISTFFTMTSPDYRGDSHSVRRRTTPRNRKGR
ncbi:ATP-binding protein [Chloroflexota bacterium]